MKMGNQIQQERNFKFIITHYGLKIHSFNSQTESMLREMPSEIQK